MILRCYIELIKKLLKFLVEVVPVLEIKGRLKVYYNIFKMIFIIQSFEDKLTHLFFALNKFHCFFDGNKRIAISAGALFLNLNGYVFRVADFISEMENISYHVAAGKVNKGLLKEIITAVLYDDMENEELKLKIYNAIND
ncbi:MAG: type II toxin-antitoxin system death-on-curing family toxin [Candidatus Cloacimonadales bacterium]|nr:type II toxin-antitoxin system death-on-curing family toxin [Candidatus Cloacimonadales bacterium]